MLCNFGSCFWSEQCKSLVNLANKIWTTAEVLYCKNIFFIMGSLCVVNDVYVLAFWVLSCNFSYFHLFTFCGMTVHFFVTSLSVNIFLVSFKEKLWVVLSGILELK